MKNVDNVELFIFWGYSSISFDIRSEITVFAAVCRPTIWGIIARNHVLRFRSRVAVFAKFLCLMEFPIRINETNPGEFRGCWVVSFNFITILKSTFCKKTEQLPRP